MSSTNVFWSWSKVQKCKVPADYEPPRRKGFKKVQKIETLLYLKDDLICPFCKGPVEKNSIIVADEIIDDCVIVLGLYCPECDVLYFPQKKKKELDDALREYCFSKGYLLNGKSLTRYFNDLDRAESRINYLKEQRFAQEQDAIRVKKLFERCSSAFACFHVISNRGSKKEFYLAEELTESSENVFECPADWRARELLTAYYEPSRNGKLTFSGVKYSIIKVDYNPQKRYAKDGKDLLIPLLEISDGGGYKYHIQSPRKQKIIHALLYSPVTKRYETVQATCEFDKDGEVVRTFIDISIFRNFVKEYGNPGKDSFYFSKTEGMGDQSRLDWESLETESILKRFGYNVQEKEALSDTERRQILTEIIDLEFMTQRKIINHLDFCIRSHPSVKYISARKKWESDQKYVISYHAHPERFLIPQTIKKK